MSFHIPDQLDKKPATCGVSSSRVPAHAKQKVTSSVRSCKPSPGSVGFVTELSCNDVLVGRGTPAIENEGNIRFRQLVQSHKLEYINAPTRKIKSLIARQVAQTVAYRQGLFLRLIESPSEAAQMGVPEGVKAWVPVHAGIILEKVKLALRLKVRHTRAENKIQNMEQRISSSERVKALVPVQEGPIIQRVKKALGDRDTGEEDKTPDVAAAEHTQGIARRGSEVDMGSYLDKQAPRNRDTVDEDKMQDVVERVSSGVAVAAAGHTQGIAPRGSEVDTGSNLDRQDTGDEDKIQDVEERVSRGVAFAAAGHTKGIPPFGSEVNRGSSLDRLKQIAVLQQRMDIQQHAVLLSPSSLSPTVSDFLYARQAEKHKQQVHTDQARDRANTLNKGIGDYPPMAQQGKKSRYPGGTNNGEQFHPGMAELRNAPVGTSFPMPSANWHVSSVDLLLARDARSTLAGSGIAREPSRASETSSTGKVTRGEIAVFAAVKRAQQLFRGSPSGSYLDTSIIEMLLLSVLCSHGLPVWEPPNHKSTDARPEGAEAGSLMFTWSDFGSLLTQSAKEWHDWIYSSSDLAVNDDSRAELRATVLAARYKADPEELARKTTSLLEKLRIFMGPDHSGISAWFEEELCRWAITLSIADKRLHPVAYAASDFVSAHPQYTRNDDVKTSCAFDTQSCRHIIFQVAYLSRLRSVFLSDKGRGIGAKVAEASTRSISSGQVWISRPSWWGSTLDAVSYDIALLRSLLKVGFLGVLEELSGTIPESASGRELGLSKASIQEHMEILVPHLHQSQETSDRRAILKGLEARHFNNASEEPRH